MKKYNILIIAFISAILVLSSCSLVEKTGDNIDDSMSKISESCTQSWGNWLEEFKECEYTSKEWCDENWGNFNECASACRNDPEAEMCTMQCVPLCKFSINDTLDNKSEKVVLSQEEAEKLIIKNIWDCSTNECDNFKVTIINWEDWKTYIESIYDWLKDDSVRAIKRLYMVDFVDSKWVLWNEEPKEFKCQNWRWQEDFGKELCK